MLRLGNAFAGLQGLPRQTPGRLNGEVLAYLVQQNLYFISSDPDDIKGRSYVKAMGKLNMLTMSTFKGFKLLCNLHWNAFRTNMGLIYDLS